ncbi:CYTH domain-containing protein, partial [Bacillus pumilus]|nr:CYTH domain-containing protein [Bacillus pumilus]
LNKEDFEIEFEVDDRKEGQMVFLNLLQQLNIPVRKTENKIKRFYNEKYRQQKA